VSELLRPPQQVTRDRPVKPPLDAATARRRIAAASGLNAFISVADEDGPGPVVAVKDLIDVAGMVTTGGGAILPNTPAVHDAPCVRALRDSGGLVIGKTNLHEWALGPTSSNPHHGFVRNPRDTERIPGGSSGGSAAAVAAGLCDWAIGTDTGGSIRMPASLCGVVGYKPTYGSVSTENVIPLAASFDTVGPIAADVITVALGLEMLSGRTGMAPDEAPAPVGVYGVATPSGWVDGLDGETDDVWRRVSAGLPQIDFPDRESLTATFKKISGYEAAQFHRGWIETCPERYGSDVLARLLDGMQITDDEYSAGLAEREVAKHHVAAAMSGWDAIMLPATACVAPRLDDPDRREPLTRFLRAFSVTGQPVLVLPAPTLGLPVGIQFVGHPGEDAALLRIGLAFEAAWMNERGPGRGVDERVRTGPRPR
jgi:aspartyl-tRNA(Asn)/glutamyl-tRNA(Gln) amidotransferase subunit A